MNRRNFLKSVGLTLGALSLGSLAKAEKPVVAYKVPDYSPIQLWSPEVIAKHFTYVDAPCVELNGNNYCVVTRRLPIETTSLVFITEKIHRDVLKAIKNMGFTHVHSITASMVRDSKLNNFDHYYIYVRGFTV